MTAAWRLNRQLHHQRVGELLARDGKMCCWCGQRMHPQPARGRRLAGRRYVTVEHLVPGVVGGPDWLENLALACGACNHNRGDAPAGEHAAAAVASGLRPQLAMLAERLDSLAELADGELARRADEQAGALWALDEQRTVEHAAQRHAKAEARARQFAAAAARRRHRRCLNRLSAEKALYGRLEMWEQVTYEHLLESWAPARCDCADPPEPRAMPVTVDGSYGAARWCPDCGHTQVRRFAALTS